MLLFNYQIGIKFKMPKINREDRMRKTKKTPEYQATIKRSLHYFFEVNKKYKWYNLAIFGFSSYYYFNKIYNRATYYC